MLILKKAMKFLFILEQIPVQVAKYSEFWSFYVYRCTHMFRLLRRHLLLHIIVCKTSMLKFSIALEFFICSLFKEY